jgi:hypothetical protein
MNDIAGIIGIGAVMLCPMIALGVTLIFSIEATKDIGNE